MSRGELRLVLADRAEHHAPRVAQVGREQHCAGLAVRALRCRVMEERAASQIVVINVMFVPKVA